MGLRTALFCALASFGAIGMGQVRLTPAHQDYASFDKQRVGSGQASWVITIDGHKTDMVMLGFKFQDTQPKISDVYANARGEYLFTVYRGIAENTNAPYWSTFLYRNGKLSFLASDRRAYGLADGGAYLLAQVPNTQASPSVNLYATAQTLQVVVKDRTYDLGIVADAALGPNKSVRGVFYVDGQGKRGNGHANSQGVTWTKRTFVWDNGQMRILS